ncbi:Hemolysin, contains CBS domains [Nakamurella panacisegetis]|uniref:Hemolysin, contains CBS domains n=1 Tax=Nakamurella panacisegetis TaxID=1090615 RepID=A0A1H0RSN5_9ACTN|nr:hemolysin family protein [Nakamurella panacisegetis]SDP32430.1 Hemolysin, contains CBS domains [Nakamurella panacisegetis]
MNGTWGLIALVVFLLALSAFFVAAEFSLISARRTVIEPRAVTSARARATLKAMENISVMMACAQLGITVCGVLLGALGEPAVATLLEPVFHAMGVPASALHPVALVVALLLVVSAHVALGEMVPKNVALAGPENTAILLAPPLRAIALFLGPIVRGLNHVANGVVRMLGREPRDEVASAFTRDEVAGLVAESRSEGLLDRQEHDLITSALEFDTAKVDSVLLADADVVSVQTGVTAAEIEQACARTGFSRFPVRGDDGKFVGYVHIRDVIDIPPEHRDEPVPAGRIRPLPVVVTGTDLRLALDRMRRLGAHLAQVAAPVPVTVPESTADPVAVLDAIAATSAGPPEQPLPEARLGLVTLEDVIEELIGEVRDSTRRRPQTSGPTVHPAQDPSGTQRPGA